MPRINADLHRHCAWVPAGLRRPAVSKHAEQCTAVLRFLPTGSQPAQDLERGLPERRDCGDLHALIGAVRALDGGAVGHRVHAGHLLQDDSALQARMDGPHLRAQKPS